MPDGMPDGNTRLMAKVPAGLIWAHGNNPLGDDNGATWARKGVDSSRLSPLSRPATAEEQLAREKVLKAQIDAAWEKASEQVGAQRPRL